MWVRFPPGTQKTGSSAVGSALRSGRRGRAFESPLPDKTDEVQIWFNYDGIVKASVQKVVHEGEVASPSF